MKKVIYPLFYTLSIVLNFAVMLALTAPAVNAQNCVCAECNASCESISSYGHNTWCSYYVAPSSSSSTSSSSSSSSSASSSYSGSSYSYNPAAEMASGLMEAAFDELFTWLFSDNSSSGQQKDNTDYAKLQAEYKEKVSAQVSSAKTEYEKQMLLQTQEQMDAVVDEFKNKLAISEAAKAVKQLNCAANKSILITKKKIYDFSDFDDLEGDAEEFSKLADFSTSSNTDCPPIKLNIPEVNATRTVSFQQLYYSFILHRSDSIQFTIDTLKEKKDKNDIIIVEKKKKIEDTKLVIEQQKTQTDTTTNQVTGNQLLQDALKQLEIASQELQTAEDLDAEMQTEIETDEKNIQALEKMRSIYDTDNK